MSPILILHIAAGSLAILSGFAALAVAKGTRLHRAFGTVFVAAMLAMSAMGIYLAAFVPPLAPGSTPPRASMAVGALTFYLVATGWMTVRRGAGRTGLPEKVALAAVLAVIAVLLTLGMQAALGPRPPGTLVAPYFVFAGFGAFAAACDLKVILRGGISGVPRIARHLWRMCFGLFFASAFFFIGQQKVMPAALHRSPLLLVPAVAPLVLLLFWLIRVRATKWYRADAAVQGA